MSEHMTIGDFLLRRLAEVGTGHVFGVPGDYNMSFLEQLLAHRGIEWIGTCNELNAAYAADGYARSGRPGVLLTTFGVGCLSALNGVAGAYCEHVPLIHISGSPPAHAVADGVALHHSLLDGGYRNVHRAFEEFTAYAATISTTNAVEVIDHALVTAFRSRRPVRLELPSDLTHVEIPVPTGILDVSDPAPAPRQIDDAAAVVASALMAATRPLLLFDLPAVRWGALDAIEAFCAALEIPYACTLPAVHHAASADGFLGMLPSGRADRQELFDRADLLITCGLTRSDVTTGGFTLDLDAKHTVRLGPTSAQLDTAVYYGTTIGGLLDAVAAQVCDEFEARDRWWKSPAAVPPAPDPESATLTEKHFFARLQSFVRPGDVLIAETGTSAQNTVGLPLPDGVRYVNQSSWGSIGYALPALLGSLIASPDRRHILCTGDGSFQVTAQELSTILRHGLTPVVFLLNNRGYTIERSILGANSAYNDVANWAYHELPRVFGGSGAHLSRICTTPAELDDALHDAAEAATLAFIQVELEPLDMTPATTVVGDATRRFDYGVYALDNPLR
ncbi:alpha-keto acid decarboxylase family protein [Mycobacterium sp. WMMD1722]|uniref:alpha-keto acid decarboxylase family protein n=1 Tax=Mycobacterium sp. WMMD1722 TaxID=3404117 RepID=UPI003BF5E4B8